MAYVISDACVSCGACEGNCPVGAISFDKHQKAHINKEKCVNCGKCASVCPYSAIANRKRPCEAACKVGAIGKDEQQFAHIDNSKCISCGACISVCPTGARNYHQDAYPAAKAAFEEKCAAYRTPETFYIA